MWGKVLKKGANKRNKGSKKRNKVVKKRNKVLTGSTCVLYLLLYCSDVYKLGRSVYHIGNMGSTCVLVCCYFKSKA